MHKTLADQGGHKALGRQVQFRQHMVRGRSAVENLDLLHLDLAVGRQRHPRNYSTRIEKPLDLLGHHIARADRMVDTQLGDHVCVVGPVDNRHNAFGAQLAGLDTGHDIVFVVAHARGENIGAAHPLFLEVAAALRVGVDDGRMLQMGRQEFATVAVDVHQQNGEPSAFQNPRQVIPRLATAGDYHALLGRLLTLEK